MHTHLRYRPTFSQSLIPLSHCNCIIVWFRWFCFILHNIYFTIQWQFETTFRLLHFLLYCKFGIIIIIKVLNIIHVMWYFYLLIYFFYWWFIFWFIFFYTFTHLHIYTFTNLEIFGFHFDVFISKFSEIKKIKFFELRFKITNDFGWDLLFYEHREF